MASRYNRLFSLPENLYTPGSPVLISAGALLSDSQTGKVLAQLKFKNIFSKQIKAVTVSITAYDVLGKELAGVPEYQYLDLSAERDSEFGSRIPIPLPDKVTRSICVRCTAVVFDGGVWEAPQSAHWEPLPPQIKLSEKVGDELVSQYRRDTVSTANFVPQAQADIWRCTCGGINCHGERTCHICHIEMDSMLSALDKKTLEENKQIYDVKQSEKRKAEEATAQKARIQRLNQNKKFVKVAVCAIAILCSCYFLKNMMEYNAAKQLLSEGKKSDAAIIWGQMGGYRDAHKRSFELWNQVATRNTIAAGDCFTVGVKSNGTLMATEFKNDNRNDVSGWSNIVAIEAKGYTVGLKSNGTVVAVGKNDYGRCEVSDWENIVAIAAGFFHTVGIHSDGAVIATGSNEEGQCEIASWTDIVAITAGNYHTVGLKSNGTVVAAGSNDYGQCEVSDWTDIIAVAAGDGFTIGLRADGSVIAAGDNHCGQCNVSDWENIIAVSAGESHTIGLKSDGAVVATGYNYGGQCNVNDWQNIIAISAGDFHTVGLTLDGKAVSTTYIGSPAWDHGQSNISGWPYIQMP